MSIKSRIKKPVPAFGQLPENPRRRHTQENYKDFSINEKINFKSRYLLIHPSNDPFELDVTLLDLYQGNHPLTFIFTYAQPL